MNDSQTKLKARLLKLKERIASYSCHGAERYLVATGKWNGWNPEHDGARYVERLDNAGLRFVGWSSDIARVAIGYYTDSEFHDETLRGCVLQLPGRNHCARYVAAYADPYNKGAYRVDVSRGIIEGDTLEYSTQDDSGMRDAAIAADSFADHEAERQRDYNEAWRAGSDFAALGEEVTQHRRDALALIREIKTAGKFPPAICEALRSHVTSHLESIRKAREEREELCDSVWRDYFAAFNDGAGETVLVAR